MESRPVGCGWFWFIVGLSLSFSPPSNCVSLPSMMTWEHAHTASVLVEGLGQCARRSCSGGLWSVPCPGLFSMLSAMHCNTANGLAALDSTACVWWPQSGGSLYPSQVTGFSLSNRCSEASVSLVSPPSESSPVRAGAFFFCLAAARD